MKKQNQTLYAVLCAITALLFAACALQAPPADSGGTGRVIISITGADDSFVPETALSVSRTLLPELGSFGHYKLEFIRQGETEPALTRTITETSLELELDPGGYTLELSAWKTGATFASARASVPVTVLAGETVDITVALTLNKAGAGALEYAVTLSAEITLTRGSLTLYPLSYSANSLYIDLNAGSSGVTEIPSGYYRAQLFIFGAIGGVEQFAAITSVLHIINGYSTNASYTLGSDDFASTETYTAGNQIEFNYALDRISAASGAAFTILVNADFSSGPVSLTGEGYGGKIITLRGEGGGREISLSSQGSFFTVGSVSSEPLFILRDITLKGINGNNAALLKLNNGALIMESGAAVTGNENKVTSSPYSSQGGGVYVTGGSFAMRGGATVNGNTASSPYSTSRSYGGGVYVAGGSFTMQDSATVSGNTASSYNS